jgi:hypothetical protein
MSKSLSHLLVEAACQGDAVKVTTLMATPGAQSFINYHDTDWSIPPPIYCAAANGHASVAKQLIAVRCNVDLQAENGWTLKFKQTMQEDSFGFFALTRIKMKRSAHRVHTHTNDSTFILICGLHYQQAASGATCVNGCTHSSSTTRTHIRRSDQCC